MDKLEYLNKIYQYEMELLNRRYHRANKKKFYLTALKEVINDAEQKSLGERKSPIRIVQMEMFV